MAIVPIVFAFDQSLEMPAGVCIGSLLDNAAPDTFYDIFVLHGPDSDFSASRLNELPEHYSNCRLTFRKVEGEFVGGYEIRGISVATYYRLIVPEMIPEYDKILYSDVDVIFREDLSRYYCIDLGDNYFGGVDNGSRIRPEVRKYMSEQLGLDWQNGYYYAGNLIIHSKLLLADGKLEEFRRLGKNAYFQQDMDIINIACNGRFLPLGPAFCFTGQIYNLILNRRQEVEPLYGKEEIEHALRFGTVHYTGAKPWKELCPNMDIWWKYYRKSIFFDESFTHDFWEKRCSLLQDLPLMKRIKLLLRYPLDRRHTR